MPREYKVNTIGHWQGIEEAISQLNSSNNDGNSSISDIILQYLEPIQNILESIKEKPLEDLYEFITTYNTDRQEHFTNDYVPYINGKISAVLYSLTDVRDTVIKAKTDIITAINTQGAAIVAAINALKPAQ